jgi:hypothetical protein
MLDAGIVDEHVDGAEGGMLAVAIRPAISAGLVMSAGMVEDLAAAGNRFERLCLIASISAGCRRSR